MFARYQPFIAVLMRRENQRGIVHRVQAAPDRMFHHRRAFWPAAVKHIVARLVDQAEMGVQARPGIFRIGFGHEAGGKAVAARQTLDQHLEQPGIIGGAQGVVAMHQVDLKLPQARLRSRGVGRNVHRFAGVVQIGEEGVESVQRPDRQRFRRLAPLAGPGRGWNLHGLARIVDQEKLQLDGADRGQATGLEAVYHGAQGVARITFIGCAVFAEHPDRQQGRWRL